MYVEHGTGIRALLTWLGGEPRGKTPLSGFAAVPPVMWNRPAMIHRQQMWGLEIKSVPDGSTDAHDSQHLLHII